MTYEQINSLTLESEGIRDLLSFRLFMDSLPEEEEEIPSYTDEELEAELVEYKAEETALEDDRLRKVALRNRLSSLKDARLAFNRAYPDKSNPDKFFEEIMDMDEASAELAVATLESKDAEGDSDRADAKFKKDREKAYEEAGCSKGALLEALIEHLAENRPAKLIELQAKRAQVKQDVPKPE